MGISSNIQRIFAGQTSLYPAGTGNHAIMLLMSVLLRPRVILSRNLDNIKGERCRATALWNITMPRARIAPLLYCAWLVSISGVAQLPGEAGLKERALALMEQGRVKEAVATFREALQSAPRDVEILNDLGVALRKDGDLAGSLDALRAALKLRQDDARIHSNLALTLRTMGRPNQPVPAIPNPPDLIPR